MKTLPLETKKEAVIVIEGDRIRVKENNKLARYIRRNYGLGKNVAKAMKKDGLKEGENVVPIEQIMDVLSKVKTRKERSAKKIFEKVELNIDSEHEISIDGIDTSNKARRFYRRKVKENLGENIHCKVEKVLPGKSLKIVVASEVEKEEVPNFDEFF